MKDNIRKFFNLLGETKKNEEINENLIEDKKYHLNYLLDIHNFYLAYQTNYHTIVYNNFPSTLIKLDKEDIEYFVKKYYPKLKEEMEDNLQDIKNKYKSVI